MSPEPPLDATGIARRKFSTARKGYDPAEVRAYLNELSESVGRLQREGAHEHERAERAESRAELAERLDEHRLVELLGAETARVLDAAREAAAGIRVKAEESAARMVREAQAEAHATTDQAERDAKTRRASIVAEAEALRREAEDELERRRAEALVVADDLRRDAEAKRDEMLADAERVRSEAAAAGEQIRAAARDQGRRLVGEAQAVRERILADLARRRRTAREQLERLNGARERLLAAYEVVRRTVDEATHELSVALPEARTASAAAVQRVRDEPDESVDVIEAELSVARMSGAVDTEATAVSDDELDAMLRELAEEQEAQAAARRAAEEEGAGDDEARTEGTDEDGADASNGSGGSEGDAGGHAVSDDVPDPRPATESGPSSPPARAAVGDAPPAGRPQSDAQRWGVRLPRSRSGGSSRRRGAQSTTAETPAVAPAGATSSLATVAHAGDRAGEPDAGSEGETGPYVDELFARIRAERTGDDADVADLADSIATIDGQAEPDAPPEPAGRHGADAAADAETAASASDAAADATAESDAAAEADEAGDDDEDEPLDPVARTLKARDDVLAAVERDLGRRLKRVLADEQNEVLDTLRRGGTVELDDILPAEDEHVDRYAIAAGPDLDASAGHGTAAAGGSGSPSCDELAGALGRVLVRPLRARVQRSFADADGDVEEVSERVRSLYREWKGQHIGEAVRHYTAEAYSVGVAGALPAGEARRWLVDASCAACPDCDDNALAGEVSGGEPFPTGDMQAPAHADCRCLVVAASALDDG